MAFFNKYPYTDMHELNLDWIISRMRQLEIEFNEFEVVNQITFSGTWDITKQYPAWTIVSDNNIGYVSIQPVPAGVVLTNSDYWRTMIDYTAQIAGLQSRVVALENTVGDASSGLVKDVNDLQTDMSNVQDDIDLVAHKRVIFIGDSYGEAGSFVYPVWSDIVPGIISFDNVYKNCVSGCGFTSSLSFQDLLTNVGASIPDKTKITDIYVLGGINDHTSSYSDIDDAIEAFVTFAKTYYPNANIKIGHISMTTDATVQYNMRYNTYPAYKDSTQYGCEFLNGLEYVLSDYSLLNPDGVHPTQTGQEILSRAIVECMLNGSFNQTMFKTSTVSTPLTDIWPNTHNGIAISLNNGHYNMKSVDSDGLTINSATPFNINASGTILLNVDNKGFPKGNGNVRKDIAFRYKLQGETTWDHISIGRLVFDGVNNQIKIYSDTITISNVVGVGLSGFEFECGLFGY